MKRQFCKAFGVGVLCAMASTTAFAGGRGDPEQSVARQWMDELLEAIRHDQARPVVHARNLFHVSVAMWDSWAAYEQVGDTYMTDEEWTVLDKDGKVVTDPGLIRDAQEETISFAAYRVLKARFAQSPGAETSLAAFDALMDTLGYDKDDKSIIGPSPAARGNRLAIEILAYGLADLSNEQEDYAPNNGYEPVNEPLLPDLPGNPDITDVNRWQPLALDFFIDQSGIVLGPYPGFLGPHWGWVSNFSLSDDDLTIYERDGYDYYVYHDPGPPPMLGDPETDGHYKWGNEMVSIWQAMHDPTDGVMIDISPASVGNLTLPKEGSGWDSYFSIYDFDNGGDVGEGYDLNPVTGKAYEPQIVPRGDYGRILAEFWADGPDSETPPGHWFTILNYVNDHPLFEKRLGGEGPILDDLEWDVKAYLALGGAMHDAAIASWGVKGWYDYVRPISAIRYMCDQGQSSDSEGPSFAENGINLYPGLIEVITEESAAPGERHEFLQGFIGEIALNTWRGPDFIADPETDDAGVGWIRAANWWPYQRPTFVTPPFAGYVSGHSTYSRAAAEVMTLLTGSQYFPGGMGEFFAPQSAFLVFEDGPSVDCTLQWATYQDASDQCSLSRIFGGIHPPADDVPGRLIGLKVGPDAFDLAVEYFNGQFSCPLDLSGDGLLGPADLAQILGNWGRCGKGECAADLNDDGIVGPGDLAIILGNWDTCG